MSSEKRKKVVVSMEQKLEALQRLNNNDIQEWSNQDKEQQLTDDIVDLVNHASNGNLEDDNEGPEKADRMSHSE
jgi:hypothetical protein